MRQPVFAALLTTAVLAACGGGGGGSTPAPSGAAITSANYVATAQEALTSASFISSSTNLLVGAEVADSGMLLERALGLARGIGRRLPVPANLATGAIISSIDACSGGGNVTVAVDDRNNNNKLDSGDSVKLTMSSCVEAGVQMGGVMNLSYDSVTGDISTDVFSTRVTVDMDNFFVQSALLSSRASGRITLAETSRASNDFTLDLGVQSLSSTVTLAGSTITRTQTDYTLRLATTPAGTGSVTALTMSGVLVSSAIGSGTVTVATETPLSRAAGATYPNSGRISVTGASGAKVRVTAQDATNAQIELDANGDGTFETSTTRAWNTLL